MQGIWALAVLWVLFAELEAQNGSRNRVQQSKQPVQSKRAPFKSWNSQMYPIWNGGEDQKRDCWKGGEVTFDIVNDSPTLTGAKTTFSIKLNFPKNQTVLPDGQVIWNQNCTENGTWVSSGEPVYLDETTEGSDCSFPDGRPFPLGAEKRRSKFVYVWQTWGKYWQVVDGPVSNLTVDTDDIPLGSYNMEVVVYHYRGRQKFIPIGSTSSQFAITDQIPVSVSISQLQDLNQADQRFIQNRAVSFSVAVHDPSHYLQAADISFSWDFGDQSGTLITRNTDVTHTYISSGVFRPKLTMQAAIPISPCGSTAASITEGTDTTNVPPEPTTEAEASTTGVPVLPTETESPSNTTLPVEAELITAESELNMEVVTDPEVVPAEGEAATDPEVVPAEGEAATDPEVVPAEGEAATDAEVVPAEGEAATDAEVVPAEGEAATDAEVVPAEGEAATDAEVVPAEGEAATVAEVVPAEGEAATVPEVVPAEGEAATVPEVVPAEGEAATVAEVVPAEGEAATVPEVVPAEGEAATVPEVVPAEGEAVTVPEAVPAEGEAVTVPEAVPAEGEAVTIASEVEVASAAQTVAATGQEDVLLLAKRQAPEDPLVGCLLYRYGTFATELDVVQGIESVEIVQVDTIAAVGVENAVDLTITCQGGLPSQVCTVISDSNCQIPQETLCNPVEPSSDCQMVLRQVFNGTGTFCVNVSLTDSVSLAVASTQVTVSGGPVSSTNGIIVTVGILLAALAVVAVAYTYRRTKSYTPLRTENASINWFPDRSSLRLFFQNALGRSINGESSPLLNGHVV
ncbi:melanocyte PMEL isoform X2 [Pelobates cultripes]|uniref:Melanocyte PMEL isoform X2 n=1 Tax=Pelobates cultripes TaxID=61616 RepID=A0AAD1R5E2_PELCU|nr:melanocyte PMEL isoform X2 [Pelobates cultripes]